MLTDPLPLKRLALSAHAAITVTNTDSWPRVDAGDGSARYELASATVAGIKSAEPATLRISHSVSNEQKPIRTRRTLVRFDFPVLGNDGKIYNSYGYAVIGMPQTVFVDPEDTGTPVAPAAYARGVVEHLIAALAVSSTAATLDETKIDRIIAGES